MNQTSAIAPGLKAVLGRSASVGGDRRKEASFAGARKDTERYLQRSADERHADAASDRYERSGA